MGAAEDVLAGALSDWEWVIDVAAVHVLFHDGEDLGVDLGDSFDDWGQVWDAVWWFDHDALGYGFGKWGVVL